MKKMLASLFAMLALAIAAPVLAQDNAVEGLELQLKDADGKVVKTCVTTKDGSWSFDGLDAGDYTLDIDARKATKTRSNIQNNRMAAMKAKEKANRTKSSDYRDADSDGDGLDDSSEEIRFNLTFDEITYNVKSPRDLATGQSSGKRTHKPVTFVKEWGPSTPQFKVTQSGGKIKGHLNWDLATSKGG
jgi:hypothetical protein